ncbi:MAG: replication initiation protein [bacterium]
MLKKEYPTERSNLLTEMRAHSMTLQELRFLSIYLSKINPLDVNSRYVEFKLDEFQKIMELGRIDKNHIKEVFTRLLCKVVEIPINTGSRKGFAMVTLFNKCQCFWDDDTEETLIIIDAHDDTLPLLFDLQNNFLKYKLWNCLRLKSVNQVRMYEILKQYETTKDKSRTLSIEDLKDMLGIDKKEYPVWQDFKTKVLEVCKKALKENTDIYFEYEPIKKGRKFVAIKFLIFKNKDYKDPLQLDEFIQTNNDVIEVDFNDVTSSVMSDDEPEPTHKNIFESSTEPIVQKEHIYKESFLDEFNQDEINAFYQNIKHKEMKTDENNEFIQKQYNQMLVSNSKKKVYHGFKYLNKIIMKEIDNYTPPTPKRKTSYDIEEAQRMLDEGVPDLLTPEQRNELNSAMSEFNHLVIVELISKDWSKNVLTTLSMFINYRKKDKKSPFTDYTLPLFIEELKKYNDDEKIEVMNYSMTSGFPNIYPPKQNQKSNNKKISDEKLKALEEEFNY